MRPILITGGATQNPIDAMRCITAYATGNTAIKLGIQLHPLNQQTYLLCSQMAKFNALHQNYRHHIQTFTSTRDLEQKMLAWLEKFPNGIVIHSAAVGDYEVQNDKNQGHKISSNQSELVIKLRPAPKILPQLKAEAPLSKVISFKAASPDLSQEEMIKIAKNQLHKSKSDLVFANQIGQTHQNLALVLSDDVLRFERRSDAISKVLSLVSSWMTQEIE